MKLIVLITVLFCHGLLAAVYHQPENDKTSARLLVLPSDIPIIHTPGSDLSLLNQLQLKVHSNEEKRQHIWERVQKCESCHAFKLYAGNGYLPILQGQNQEYLYSKLLMFKNNQRSYHPLGRYIEKLSSQDLMDISSFYADQGSDLKRSLVPVDFPQPEQMSKSERQTVVSIQQCSECHAESGNGGQLIPAISGQNKKYLSYRIREIADNSSRVHFDSEAPVSCKIKDVNIRQSRQLASLLSVVIDTQRADKGAEVYRSKCAECHDVGNDDDSQRLLLDNWSRHLLKGTRLLIHDTLQGNQHRYIRGKYYSFSQNEMKDAIHYMIFQLQQSL